MTLVYHSPDTRIERGPEASSICPSLSLLLSHSVMLAYAFDDGSDEDSMHASS